MADKKKSTTSHDENNSKEQFGITGVTTGSTGEHLATTGASALGTSGGSGDMGNEKSKIDKATAGPIATSSTTSSPPATSTD